MEGTLLHPRPVRLVPDHTPPALSRRGEAEGEGQEKGRRAEEAEGQAQGRGKRGGIGKGQEKGMAQKEGIILEEGRSSEEERRRRMERRERRKNQEGRRQPRQEVTEGGAEAKARGEGIQQPSRNPEDSGLPPPRRPLISKDDASPAPALDEGSALPKASPKPSPKPLPKASPKPSPKASPKASPQPSPKPSPQPSPKASPKASPNAPAGATEYERREPSDSALAKPINGVDSRASQKAELPWGLHAPLAPSQHQQHQLHQHQLHPHLHHQRQQQRPEQQEWNGQQEHQQQQIWKEQHLWRPSREGPGEGRVLLAEPETASSVASSVSSSSSSTSSSSTASPSLAHPGRASPLQPSLELQRSLIQGAIPPAEADLYSPGTPSPVVPSGMPYGTVPAGVPSHMPYSASPGMPYGASPLGAPYSMPSPESPALSSPLGTPTSVTHSGLQYTGVPISQPGLGWGDPMRCVQQLPVAASMPSLEGMPRVRSPTEGHGRSRGRAFAADEAGGFDSLSLGGFGKPLLCIGGAPAADQWATGGGPGRGTGGPKPRLATQSPKEPSQLPPVHQDCIPPMVRASTEKNLRRPNQTPSVHQDYGETVPVPPKQAPPVYQDHVYPMVRASTGKALRRPGQAPSVHHDNKETVPVTPSQVPEVYQDHIAPMVRASTGKTVRHSNQEPSAYPDYVPLMVRSFTGKGTRVVSRSQPLGGPLQASASAATPTVTSGAVGSASVTLQASTSIVILPTSASTVALFPKRTPSVAPQPAFEVSGSTARGTSGGCEVGAGGGRRKDKRSLVREAHVFDGRRHFAHGLTGGAPMALFEHKEGEDGGRRAAEGVEGGEGKRGGGWEQDGEGQGQVARGEGEEEGTEEEEGWDVHSLERDAFPIHRGFKIEGGERLGGFCRRGTGKVTPGEGVTDGLGHSGRWAKSPDSGRGTVHVNPNAGSNSTEKNSNLEAQRGGRSVGKSRVRACGEASRSVGASRVQGSSREVPRSVSAAPYEGESDWSRLTLGRLTPAEEGALWVLEELNSSSGNCYNGSKDYSNGSDNSDNSINHSANSTRAGLLQQKSLSDDEREIARVAARARARKSGAFPSLLGGAGKVHREGEAQGRGITGTGGEGASRRRLSDVRRSVTVGEGEASARLEGAVVRAVAAAREGSLWGFEEERGPGRSTRGVSSRSSIQVGQEENDDDDEGEEAGEGGMREDGEGEGEGSVRRRGQRTLKGGRGKVLLNAASSFGQLLGQAQASLAVGKAGGTLSLERDEQLGPRAGAGSKSPEGGGAGAMGKQKPPQWSRRKSAPLALVPVGVGAAPREKGEKGAVGEAGRERRVLRAKGPVSPHRPMATSFLESPLSFPGSPGASVSCFPPVQRQ